VAHFKGIILQVIRCFICVQAKKELQKGIVQEIKNSVQFIPNNQFFKIYQAFFANDLQVAVGN
jgi:acetamidase/formamidase